eukprot:Skav231156  [mRNA]  locus=scaffold3252:42639:43493:- [translate_table: standard]
MFGSRVRGIKMFDRYEPEPQDVAFVDTKHWWDLQGPLQEGRGPTARSNFIMLWKELEGLWNLTLSQEHLHGQYSHVIILRDDAFWLQDFNASHLLDLDGVKKNGSGSGDGGHLYCMLCEKSRAFIMDRVIEVKIIGITDYVFVLDRQAAETFGKSYSRLAWPALFGNEWLASYENNTVDNQVIDRSEQFYLLLAKFAEIEVIQVPASLMPMQRVAWLNNTLCLHKYCDSHWANVSWLHPESYMRLCPESSNNGSSQPWKRRQPNFTGFWLKRSLEKKIRCFHVL